MVTEGDAAPDFVLPGSDGDDVREYMLADFTREGPVVLASYLFDFHPACTEELCTLQNLGWFTVHPDATALALGTDSAFSHQAFAREHGIEFPLLSDSDGAVSERYDIRYDEFEGHRNVAKRSVFVIDADAIVRYRWVADDPRSLPNWEEIQTVLDEL